MVYLGGGLSWRRARFVSVKRVRGRQHITTGPCFACSSTGVVWPPLRQWLGEVAAVGCGRR